MKKSYNELTILTAPPLPLFFTNVSTLTLSPYFVT